MAKYYNVEPLVNLLADKDPLESVNVGAVLQALQHGLYNGEVAPVVYAHWIYKGVDDNDNGDWVCSRCGCGETHAIGCKVPYCWK